MLLGLRAVGSRRALLRCLVDQCERELEVRDLVTGPRRLHELSHHVQLSGIQQEPAQDRLFSRQVVRWDCPANHLMCYQVKQVKTEPKFLKVVGVFVNNQFGPEQLDVKKPSELCVPAQKTL